MIRIQIAPATWAAGPSGREASMRDLTALVDAARFLGADQAWVTDNGWLCIGVPAKGMHAAVERIQGAVAVDQPDEAPPALPSPAEPPPTPAEAEPTKAEKPAAEDWMRRVTGPVRRARPAEDPGPRAHRTPTVRP